MIKCFTYCIVVILTRNAALGEMKKSEWNLTETISQYNYPTEIHEIETEDGYLLDTYRIPYGRRNINKKINKLPVVMMHGMLASAEEFILAGPRKALAYLLADNGYDVWLCNARGSWHSRKHKSMNPDTDKQFWQFSWHEIGVYDIPAVIDYVLRVTNNTKVHYIGHSQGTTSFFVMASERPQYNEKIRIMVALSSAVLFKHFNHPILSLFIPIYPVIQKLLSDLKIYEAVPFISLETLHTLEKIICAPRSGLIGLCKVIISAVGVNVEEFDWILVNHKQLKKTKEKAEAADNLGSFLLERIRKTPNYLIGVLTGHCKIKMRPTLMDVKRKILPASIESREFQNYDWGAKENIRRYGTKIPPKYNLKNVTAPVALFYSENDNLVNIQDAVDLARVLPNVVELYKVPHKKWTHFDFAIAKHLDVLLNGKILEIMKKYDNL